VSQKIVGQKMLIVGTDDDAKDIINLVEENSICSYDIKGIINVGEKYPGKTFIDGYEVIDSIEDILKVVEDKKTDVIVVTTLEPERHSVLENLRVCRYRGVEIIDVVSLYEELEGQVPLKYIDDEWLFSSSLNYPGFHIKKVKRLMDIVFSIMGIILSFPVCLIAAVLIKLESKGSIFYSQKRMGRFGKMFRVLKFRSMVDRAEKGMGGPVWAKENDSRTTRVGKYLRKLRIDEIPQLINVLYGNMSLVGPRPERPAFVKELSEKIPFYPERLYVQPGLTGWAQVNHSYTSSVEETETKLQYDLYYIKHVSFLLDCRILLKTLKIVFFGKGR